MSKKWPRLSSSMTNSLERSWWEIQRLIKVQKIHPKGLQLESFRLDFIKCDWVSVPSILLRGPWLRVGRDSAWMLMDRLNSTPQRILSRQLVAGRHKWKNVQTPFILTILAIWLIKGNASKSQGCNYTHTFGCGILTQFITYSSFLLFQSFWIDCMQFAK